MELTWSSKICDNQIYYTVTEVYFIAFWNLYKEIPKPKNMFNIHLSYWILNRPCRSGYNIFFAWVFEVEKQSVIMKTAIKKTTEKKNPSKNGLQD